MVVLVTCNNDDYPIKNKSARVVTTLFIVVFFKCSRAAHSVVDDGILMKFKLTQAFMVVLDICKYEENPLKM